jgi:hypothetical protein
MMFLNALNAAHGPALSPEMGLRANPYAFQVFGLSAFSSASAL